MTANPNTPLKHTTPSHWSLTIYEYSVAILFAGILFTLFSFYLFNRRGFYDLYIMNKIFAGVATVQLGTLLVMGPLSRMFKIFDKFLRFRKEFGIIAFFSASLHSLTSLFFLPDYFPFYSHWRLENTAFWFGLSAILMLLFIFLISNKALMNALTYKIWWGLQNWVVRLVFLAIGTHVFIMKYPGWVSWYQKGGGSELVHPEWPGLGLLIGWFIGFVILVRFAEAVNQKLGKLVWYLSVLLLPAIYIFTFLWGSRFFVPLV